MDKIYHYIGLSITVAAAIVLSLIILIWLAEIMIKRWNVLMFMVEYAFYRKEFKEWMKLKDKKDGEAGGK